MKNINRIALLGYIFSLCSLVVVLQILNIQSHADDIVLPATYEEVKTPERGIIFDRNGNIFASNKKTYELRANLEQVTYVDNADTIIDDVSRIFNLDEETLRKELIEELEPYKKEETLFSKFFDNVFKSNDTDDSEITEEEIASEAIVETTSIKENEENEEDENKNPEYLLVNFADPNKIQELNNLKELYKENKEKSLYGLISVPFLQRSYPEKTIAANIIGMYMFMDKAEGGTTFGVEDYYDNLLSGISATQLIPYDPTQITEVAEIPSGANLVLTIDRQIQIMTENILYDAIEEYGAKSGTILIMDPKTGEILSMAVSTKMDPNLYYEYQWKNNSFSINPAIDRFYETGSVFKVLTMAAAMDNDPEKIDAEYTIFDDGTYEIKGLEIPNWDRLAHGYVTMMECMQKSLNVCLATLAVDELGAEKFYEYMNDFGIGHLTKIDLTGERNYPMAEPGDENWTDDALAYNSFGQGINSTPIQMISAISAVANEGRVMLPHVLKSVVLDDNVINVYPRVSTTPIRPETAEALTDLLANSLEREASDALVTGYRIAGKTGTAEVPTDTGYDPDLSNASFVGWGPVDDPKFIVYVWIEEPDSENYWGSKVAAPVFRQVVEQLVILMDIPPDAIREQLANQAAEQGN